MQQHTEEACEGMEVGDVVEDDLIQAVSSGWWAECSVQAPASCHVLQQHAQAMPNTSDSCKDHDRCPKVL